MARDLDQRLKETERLLKQGKNAAATRELRALAEESSRDPLVLNRIGDFLARVGQKEEALGLFDRIADDFFRAGFYPQAVAVLKKILRTDAQHLAAVILLGEVYAKQKLFAESRSLLLKSAETCLAAKKPDAARQIYEKLVALDPKEPLHRVRLAETRILLGDNAGGSADLVAAGESLSAADRPHDAEKAFRRAAELPAARPEAFAGIARSMVQGGRNDEAVAFLEQAARRPDVGPLLAGELFVLYERTGRREQAGQFLAGDRADALDDGAIEGMLRVHAGQGGAAEAWKRLDPLLERWTQHDRFDRLVPLLERLAGIEGEEVPALERLHRTMRLAKNQESLGRTLETLIRAYWARSMYAQASAALEELREVLPTSTLVAESLSRRSVGESAPPERPGVPAARAPAAPEPVAEPPGRAVESQKDREFIAGHLAEADAFRRHGLHDQALVQVRAVISKFPGHVGAHEKAVEILSTRGVAEALKHALVALALTRNATGDLAGALDAVTEALSHGSVTEPDRAALERTGLIAPAKAPVSAPVAPVIRKTPAPPRVEAPRDVPSLPIEVDGEEPPEIEILFDDAPEEMIPAPSSARRQGEIPADSVEEISFFAEQGMHAEALDRIAELRELGFGGAQLDELERRAKFTVAPEAASPVESSVLRLDDDDLDSISQALEAAIGAAPVPALPPPAPTQEGIDDVFAAFKEQVAAEVGHDDYRTHYDLGIAYKEMGLIDDAINQFRTATQSPETLRDACSMLAMCHRERGELALAVEWFRKALEVPGVARVEQFGLRYELADVLAASGDVGGALETFGGILAEDPAYRDVAARIEALRASPYS